MDPNTRYVKIYRGDRWSDKMSLSSVHEGDVFALFEGDGKRVRAKSSQVNDVAVFRAIKPSRMTKGIWGVECEPYLEKIATC